MIATSSPSHTNTPPGKDISRLSWNCSSELLLAVAEASGGGDWIALVLFRSNYHWYEKNHRNTIAIIVIIIMIIRIISRTTITISLPPRFVKYELRGTGSAPWLCWSLSDPLMMFSVTCGGGGNGAVSVWSKMTFTWYQIVQPSFIINSSSSSSSSSRRGTIIIVDGNKLLITPSSLCLIPPPMSACHT